MAISIRATGTPIYGTANLTPTIPDAQATGDMMICFYGTKPYSDAPTIGSGWTSLGYATDGTVAAGVDVGSMQSRIFYKIATSDLETNPLITNTTNNVSTAIIIVFQKGASENWATPVGAGGGDDTAGTDFSVTMSSDVGHTTGDMCVGFASFRSNDATPTTARALSITGCTLGTYVQSPSVDPETTSGGDMGLTGGYVPVNSGTSTAAPVFTATLGAAHTGSAYWCRLRLSTAYTLTAEYGAFTESGQSIGTKADRKIGVDYGSFTEAGQVIGLKTDRKITASQGSFTQAGQALNFIHGYIIATGYGNFSLSGQAINLLADRKIGVNYGSFTLSGQNIILKIARSIAIGQGSFTLSGQSVGLLAGRKISIGQGSYTLAGQDVILDYSGAGYTLVANLGSFLLTGENINLYFPSARKSWGAASREVISNREIISNREVYQYRESL